MSSSSRRTSSRTAGHQDHEQQQSSSSSRAGEKGRGKQETPARRPCWPFQTRGRQKTPARRPCWPFQTRFTPDSRAAPGPSSRPTSAPIAPNPLKLRHLSPDTGSTDTPKMRRSGPPTPSELPGSGGNARTAFSNDPLTNLRPLRRPPPSATSRPRLAPSQSIAGEGP